MRVVIISDIHDNEVNLIKCLHWCRENKIGELICCGDIANDDTVKVLAKGFEAKIHLVKGNAELHEESILKKYKNIKYYNKIGTFKIGNFTVGICHEPYLIMKVLEQDKCDIVFYGHTHKPWIEKQQGVQTVNPGTLGAVFNKSTFAFWDSDKGILELKMTDDL